MTALPGEHGASQIFLSLSRNQLIKYASLQSTHGLALRPLLRLTFMISHVFFFFVFLLLFTSNKNILRVDGEKVVGRGGKAGEYKTILRGFCVRFFSFRVDRLVKFSSFSGSTVTLSAHN